MLERSLVQSMTFHPATGRSLRALAVGLVSRLAHAVELAAHSAGIRYAHFENRDAFLRALHAEAGFDVLLLDWTCREVQSLQFLGWLRQNLGARVIIVVLASHMEEAERAATLTQGADICMCEPIGMNELVARIAAAVRHSRHLLGKDTVISAGAYTCDLERGHITLHGSVVPLSPREFQIARILFQNLGHLVSRETIEHSVWAVPSVHHARTIDSHICRIRAKLDLGPHNGLLLSAQYARGLLLSALNLPPSANDSTHQGAA